MENIEFKKVHNGELPGINFLFICVRICFMKIFQNLQNDRIDTRKWVPL